MSFKQATKWYLLHEKQRHMEDILKINKDLEWSSDDILIVGFWNKNGDYNEPEKEWRYNNSEEE